MAQDKLKRKLTTILGADVAGYSRLMGEDSEWTVRTLDTFKGVMKTIIPNQPPKLGNVETTLCPSYPPQRAR